MKLLKHMSELYDEELDRRSQELFDKNFIQLALGEQEKVHQYIHDISNPIWAPIFINGKKVEYEISNIGTVKNLKTGKLLSTYVADKNKYRYVSLTVNHVQYRKTIHRLVAIAFIPNPENKPEVNHINGKKTINWYRNLEWNTRVENMQHAAKNDLLKPRYGASSPYAIHTNEQIEEVCKLLESRKYSYKEIINKTKVHYKTLMGIIGGKKWQFIAKKYDIPKPKVSFWNEQRQHDVDDLIMKGYTTRDIIKILNYPDNNASNIWIQRRIKKVKASTTIPLG